MSFFFFVGLKEKEKYQVGDDLKDTQESLRKVYVTTHTYYREDFSLTLVEGQHAKQNKCN